MALYNADSSAQLQVGVKADGGTDVVALPANINDLTDTPSAGFLKVKSLRAPITTKVQVAKFQQKASIDYTADVSAP